MNTRVIRPRRTTTPVLGALVFGVAVALFASSCAGPAHSAAGGQSGTTPRTGVPPTTASTSPPRPPTSPRSIAGTWELLPAAPISGSPVEFSVWTGSEMLIFAVTNGSGDSVGAAYRPATRTWRRLPSPPTGTFAGQGANSAVWTGSEMVTWGAGAAAFDPAATRWHRIASAPIPGRAGPIMVWTGRLVIAWGGGCCGGYNADGASYDPATNSWRVLPASPLSGRRAAGVWTGSELVVAGGSDADGNVFADGAAYNPTTRSWRSLPPMPAPRAEASIVWDGTQVLVVGGYRIWGVHPRLYANGLAYRPSTNRWRNLPPMEQARTLHVAVWTGRRMLVWGGETLVGGKFVAPPHGLAFDPVTGRWSSLRPSPLRGRNLPQVVWTGTRMIVWGGWSIDNGQRYSDGAAYRPA
jgi:hypothetical protein